MHSLYDPFISSIKTGRTESGSEARIEITIVIQGAEKGLLCADNNLFLNMGSSYMDVCIW